MFDMKVPYVSRWATSDNDLKSQFVDTLKTFLTANNIDADRLRFNWTDESFALQTGYYGNKTVFRRAKKGNQFKLDQSHLDAIREHYANTDKAEAARLARSNRNSRLTDICETVNERFNVSVTLENAYRGTPWAQVTSDDSNYADHVAVRIALDGSIGDPYAVNRDAGNTLASAQAFIDRFRPLFADIAEAAATVKINLESEGFFNQETL